MSKIGPVISNFFFPTFPSPFLKIPPPIASYSVALITDMRDYFVPNKLCPLTLHHSGTGSGINSTSEYVLK